MRILFVITEHEDGLTPERESRYDEIRTRIAALTAATVEAEPYWAIESVTADAMVLSGSADPWAMHRPAALERFYEVLRGYPGPVLGICAGMQMLVRAGGGTVSASRRPTRGFGSVDVLDSSGLFADSARSIEVFKDHEDEVSTLPPGFRVLATSHSCRVEAVAAIDRTWWGTQFHPEAWDPEHADGMTVLTRFLELARAPKR
jgi:GMP synthase (glutamine-hydrolysing)